MTNLAIAHRVIKFLRDRGVPEGPARRAGALIAGGASREKLRGVALTIMPTGEALVEFEHHLMGAETTRRLRKQGFVFETLAALKARHA